MLLLLGEADNDPNHPSLPRQPEALAQGPNRYARGIHFFETAQKVAREKSQPFAWRCRSVPGIAHDNAGMARAAVEVIMSSLPAMRSDCPRL